jgi:hypothetical protein
LDVVEAGEVVCPSSFAPIAVPHVGARCGAAIGVDSEVHACAEEDGVVGLEEFIALCAVIEAGFGRQNE